MANRGAHLSTRLIAAAVATLALVGALALGPAEVAGAASATPDESRLVARINADRCAAGLDPLTPVGGLVDDARAWSATMQSTGRFAHTTTLGADTARHLPDSRGAAENIGRGWGVDSLHDAFMSSPGHRANALGGYDGIGVGIAVDPDGRMWVTVRFARSASVPALTGAFVDVPGTAFYADAVEWMRQRHLTTGVRGTVCYAPDATVTRGELATFVHRLAGSPAPGPRAPFPDVATGAYYQPAVDWMYNAGLTSGVGGTGLYRPGDPVDRGQMATFLHRLAGAPVGQPSHGFVDVPPSHFANAGVSWLSHHDITTGVGGTASFQPGSPVTRGQLATFLHRLVSTPSSMGPAAVPLAVGP